MRGDRHALLPTCVPFCQSHFKTTRSITSGKHDARNRRYKLVQNTFLDPYVHHYN